MKNLKFRNKRFEKLLNSILPTHYDFDITEIDSIELSERSKTISFVSEKFIRQFKFVARDFKQSYLLYHKASQFWILQYRNNDLDTFNEKSSKAEEDIFNTVNLLIENSKHVSINKNTETISFDEYLFLIVEYLCSQSKELKNFQKVLLKLYPINYTSYHTILKKDKIVKKKLETYIELKSNLNITFHEFVVLLFLSMFEN